MSLYVLLVLFVLILMLSDLMTAPKENSEFCSDREGRDLNGYSYSQKSACGKFHSGFACGKRSFLSQGSTICRNGFQSPSGLLIFECSLKTFKSRPHRQCS